MKFKMTLKERENYYGDPESQTLHWDSDGFKGRFHVNDLWECPEDATLGRALFTAWDFIEAVKFGMDLAAKGYTDIEVEKEEYEDE